MHGRQGQAHGSHDGPRLAPAAQGAAIAHRVYGLHVQVVAARPLGQGDVFFLQRAQEAGNTLMGGFGHVCTPCYRVVLCGFVLKVHGMKDDDAPFTLDDLAQLVQGQGDVLRLLIGLTPFDDRQREVLRAGLTELAISLPPGLRTTAIWSALNVLSARPDAAAERSDE